MVVEGWLARAAAVRPAHVAVETPAASLTYAELHAAADAGAAELAARGLGPGDRAAIALPAGLDFTVALHACMSLGAVAVPVDLRLAAPERERIAAGAAAVVAEPLQREPAPGAASAGAPARHAGGHGFTHDLARTALIVHTSGTAAAPRPVELTYGNLLWSALGSGVALGVDGREKWLCTLPLSHVGGLSILVRSAIYATTAVVHESFQVDRALDALSGGEITLVSLVATTLARLLDAGLCQPSSLRCALTGGGPVPTALRERALAAGVPVSLTYGLTEVCSQATTLPAAAVTQPGHTAGPPLFCTRVRIAQDGEILLSGPTVAPSAQLHEGWLATGDLGELDERGWLRVVGRKADTIVSGGENVAPAEVEAALESHPDVREAAVLGREHEQWGEAVVAIVVAQPGRSPSESELRSHLAGTLAPYKVPKQIELVAGPLPRTGSGKLLRRMLR
jgi:O-succinylbenzoic acid--CoA ligase